MIGAQRIGNALRCTVPGKNLYYMHAFSHTMSVTRPGPPRPKRMSEYRRDYIKRLFELGGFVYSTVSKTVVADEVKEFMANLTQGNGGISGFAPGVTEDSYDAWASDSTIVMRKFIDQDSGVASSNDKQRSGHLQGRYRNRPRHECARTLLQSDSAQF